MTDRTVFIVTRTALDGKKTMSLTKCYTANKAKKVLLNDINMMLRANAMIGSKSAQRLYSRYRSFTPAIRPLKRGETTFLPFDLLDGRVTLKASKESELSNG